MNTHAELERIGRSKRRTDEKPSSPRDSRAHVLALQQAAGNAAVGRMLADSRNRAPAPPAPAAPSSSMETRTETQSMQFNAAIRIGKPQQPAPAPRRSPVGADTDNPKD